MRKRKRFGLDSSPNCPRCDGLPKDPEYPVVPKIRNGEEKSQPSAEQEREPAKVRSGDAEIEGEPAYGFARNHKNTARVADGGKKDDSREEQKDEYLIANPPHELIPKWLPREPGVTGVVFSGCESQMCL